MSPRGARATSGTGFYLLACGAIEVRSQPLELHARRALERRQRRLVAYEPVPTKWGKLPNRNPISGHNEGFALVKLPHNLATVIAEFTLRDLSSHPPIVASVLHAGCLGWRGGCVGNIRRGSP